MKKTFRSFKSRGNGPAPTDADLQQLADIAAHFSSVADTALNVAQKCHAGYVAIFERLERLEPITVEEAAALRANIAETTAAIAEARTAHDGIVSQLRSLK